MSVKWILILLATMLCTAHTIDGACRTALRVNTVFENKGSLSRDSLLLERWGDKTNVPGINRVDIVILPKRNDAVLYCERHIA